MKFIFTRIPKFTRTSLNGTHNIYTHRGKSLWQSVGNEVFSATLYNKVDINECSVMTNSYGISYCIHINSDEVHCEAYAVAANITRISAELGSVLQLDPCG